MDKGIKVYIYGILDNEEEVVYVGKSSTPNLRLRHHKHLKPRYNRCKILDIFYDKEHYWINYFLDKGAKLENKELVEYVEDYKIGDIIEIKNRLQYQILNKKTGKTYESINDLLKREDILTQHYVDILLNKVERPKKPSTVLAELEQNFDLEIIN